jgi:hypothetical protein
MMFTIVKIAVSAAAIGGINFVAQAHPRVGGWIAALPLISFLSVVWLAVDGASTTDISAFVGRVLMGQIPTAVLLAILLVALSHGLSLPLAMACAGVAWAAFSLAAKYLGLFG